MIPTPKYFLRFFDNDSSRISNQFNHFIDFLLTINIICQCNAAKAIADYGWIIWIDVFRQQV